MAYHPIDKYSFVHQTSEAIVERTPFQLSRTSNIIHEKIQVQVSKSLFIDYKSKYQQNNKLYIR